MKAEETINDNKNVELSQKATENESINLQALEEIKSLKAKLDEQSKVSESLKKEKETIEKEKSSVVEARRKDAIARYTEKAKAKGLEVKDLQNATMETIEALIEMVDSINVPISKESPAKESIKEEVVDESKKIKAQFKTKEIAFKEDAKNENLVLESVTNGYSLYRFY